MSQILDSLRRARSQPVNFPDRTAHADAVLATLGYRKKRPNTHTKPILLTCIGLAGALFVAWLLWARPAGPPGTAALQPAPAAMSAPLPAPARPEEPAATVPATPADPPPQEPPRAAETP